ncbi:MAG: ATP-binding cassette domain-containing protein [Acidimicrobiia bacterium]
MLNVGVKDLVVTHGVYPAVVNSTFELEGKYFSLLTGSNGSGKTTLLKSICGLSQIQRGSIALKNEDVNLASNDYRLFRQHCAYVGHSLNFMRHIKVLEHLLLCKKFDAKNKNQNYIMDIETALEAFDLSNKSQVKVENLSAGQQRRLGLASAFVRSSPLICIDEPHSSLDKQSKDKFDDLVKKQFDLGRNFIIATHESERLKEVATHEIVMLNGQAKIKEQVG